MSKNLQDDSKMGITTLPPASHLATQIYTCQNKQKHLEAQ